MLNFKKVLLLYKLSAYQIYFSGRKTSLPGNNNPALKKETAHFKKAHDEHYSSLKRVEKIFKEHKVSYTKRRRGRKIDYSKFDLIVTVGGDGTFLEAARNVKNQAVLGINSSSRYSVGRLCAADAKNFKVILRKVLRGQFKVKNLYRLRLQFDHKKSVDAVNDLLVCHENPAALSRYSLNVKGVKEEQRSSGIWVSTAAGSSGAIQSAGGRVFSLFDKKFQYRPRELFSGKNRRYRLKGGTLSPRQSIVVASLMPKGVIYVDGAHVHFPFKYGSKVKISLSPKPLKTLTFV